MRGLHPCGPMLCNLDTNLDYDSETKFRQSEKETSAHHAAEQGRERTQHLSAAASKKKGGVRRGKGVT
jgi:hypothetical protein